MYFQKDYANNSIWSLLPLIHKCKPKENKTYLLQDDKVLWMQWQ